MPASGSTPPTTTRSGTVNVGTRSRTTYSRNAGRCSTVMPSLSLITMLPRPTPTVSLCACAAIGEAIAPAAAIAPVIAAMASILFRMLYSLAQKRTPAGQASNAGQFIARANVPEKRPPQTPQFRAIFAKAGTRWRDRRLLFRNRATGYVADLDSIIPPNSAGDISMTIGSAHIPAIVALIAGILILLAPRFL